MKRARIKPHFTKSQYSQTNNVLDGFVLLIEGGEKIKFSSKDAARKYAHEHNYQLVYSGNYA